MSKAHDAHGELIRAYGAEIMREITRTRHLRNFGFKLCTPRPRWFGTLPEACSAAEDYRKQTGVFVAIEEPRRRAWAT
jgi:hypothetical protein